MVMASKFKAGDKVRVIKSCRLSRIGDEAIVFETGFASEDKAAVRCIIAFDNWPTTIFEDHLELIEPDSAKTETDEPLEVSPTGAVCSAVDFRYDLISPVAIKRLAQVYEEGSKKYGDFNWEKGMPVTGLLNHAVAHIYNFLSGDRSEDHLGHAFWGLGAAIHSHELWPELNGDLRGEGCKPPAKEGKA